MKWKQLTTIKVSRLKMFSFKTMCDYFIYVCFMMFSFVDCLTGLFIQLGLPSIGVPFKLVLMILLLISIKSQQRLIIILYLLLLFSLCSFTYVFQKYTNFGTSLSMILKIMMYPLIFVYIKDTYINHKNGLKILERIYFFNFIVIVINQALGILGFGFNTYSDGGFGVKGFYFDGNAMAVVCFCLFVYYFSIKKNNLYALLIAVSSFLLGTKTAILAIFLFFFISLYLRSSFKTKMGILIVFSITVIVVVYLITSTDIFTYHIEKIKRMYTLFNGRILSVLLSGRDQDLHQHRLFYDEHFSLKQLLFGYGYRVNAKIIELDFFDTLFSYGLLFCIVITVMYIQPFIENQKNKEILLFNFLILMITFTSGHVWYNTSTALFLVMNNEYFNIQKKEYRIDEKNLLRNKYVPLQKR